MFAPSELRRCVRRVVRREREFRKYFTAPVPNALTYRDRTKSLRTHTDDATSVHNFRRHCAFHRVLAERKPSPTRAGRGRRSLRLSPVDGARARVNTFRPAGRSDVRVGAARRGRPRPESSVFLLFPQKGTAFIFVRTLLILIILSCIGIIYIYIYILFYFISFPHDRVARIIRARRRRRSELY